ncbi:MAG: T9SS type A sorting domain-containing protein [Lentimicrobiaceae bacterium]|nr:T9SS type A sorting domain-containing protein [Lentimicrobiaceae bacterium]
MIRKTILITSAHIRILMFSFCVLFCSLQFLNAQPVTLDPTFGQNGIAKIPNLGVIQRVIFDQSGNMFAIGSSEIFFENPVVIKTDANGIVDDSFGIVPLGIPKAEVFDFKITDENKIFFVGGSSQLLYFIRLNENGSFDNSFGENGKIVISNTTFFLSVNIENDDYLLIGDGYSILKYNYNGEIDSCFGINGKVVLEDMETFSHITPLSIKILNDQSILVTGMDDSKPYDYQIVVCKLNSIGNFVRDFANNGVWKMNLLPSWNDECIRAAIEDPDGSLLLVGYAHTTFMCCLYDDGTINNNFGVNGFSYFDNIPLVSLIQKGFLQNGNKYLIGSYDKLISVSKNGSLDPNFNNTGLFTCESYYFFDINLQMNDKLILGGSSNGTFSLMRLDIPSNLSVNQLDNSDNSIVVYPNPAKDYLHFNTEQPFEIMDIQGRILLKNKQATRSVNVSHLKAGICFIKFENNQVEKFIKE